MKTVKLVGYLENELRMRYSSDSILPFDDNKIIHQYFKKVEYQPEELKKMKFINDNIPKMDFRLIKGLSPESKSVESSFDTKLTRHLLEELGLTPTAEDFNKIRDKQLKLAVVGYGGAMINMLENMYNWAIELGEFKIFEKLVVFEKDDIDFSNLMRLGKPIVFEYIPEFTRKFDKEFKNIKTLKKTSLLSYEKELSKERRIITFVDWLDENAAKYLANKGYIFVGAPTLETRQMLSDKNFFFLGHSDYEVDITYSPQAISSLAVETYGSIDIPVLLINLQIATAAFIKTLASDEGFEPDQRILDFDMKKWVEENPKKLKELYNV
jgi:hypothetical protein